MKMTHRPKASKSFTRALVTTGFTATLMGTSAIASLAAGDFDGALEFDPAQFEVLTVTLDGEPLNVRRHSQVYVGKPIEMAATQPPRGVGPTGGAQCC